MIGKVACRRIQMLSWRLVMRSGSSSNARVRLSSLAMTTLASSLAKEIDTVMDAASEA